MAVKPLQSLQRALTVLETVAAEQPIGVAALARLLDEDKSALQRILVTLHGSGWIQPVTGDVTRWELSARPLVVASVAQQRSTLLARARPVMEALRDATGETVLLAVPDGDRIVAADVVESRHLVRTAPHIGMVLPLDTSAAALAILARLDDAAVGQYTRAAGRGEMPSDLAPTRARGWSLNDGLSTAGATSIGAPIVDAEGAPRAAIVVSAPSARLPAADYDRVGALVRAAADRLRGS